MSGLFARNHRKMSNSSNYCIFTRQKINGWIAGMKYVTRCSVLTYWHGDYSDQISSDDGCSCWISLTQSGCCTMIISLSSKPQELFELFAAGVTVLGSNSTSKAHVNVQWSAVTTSQSASYDITVGRWPASSDVLPGLRRLVTCLPLWFCPPHTVLGIDWI